VKINKLQLKDFINHKDSSLDLSQSKIHIFVGGNDQGKSAILDALSYALTGYARNISEKKDHHILVRNGAKAAEVNINLDNNIQICRRRTISGETLTVRQANNNPETSTAAQKSIYHALGCSPQTLTALLSRSNLIDMPPANFKSLIFDMLNVKPTTETIREKLLKEGLTNKELEKASDIIELAVAEGFEQAEQEAIMRRRVARREQDNLGEIEPVVQTITIDNKDYDLATLNLQSIKKNLEQLKKTKETLLEQKGRIQAIASSINDYAERKDALEKQIAELKSSIEQMDKADIVARLGRLKQEIHALTQKQIELTAQKSRLQESLLALDQETQDSNKPCPRYNITCPLEEEQKADLRKAAIEKIKDLKNKYSQTCDAFEKNEAALSRKVKEFDEARAKLNKINATIEKLSFIEQSYSKLLQRCPEKETQNTTKSPQEIEAEIEQLSTRIEKGEKLLKAAEDYQANMDKTAAIVARSHELASEITFWDKIAKSFNPKGTIMSNIIQDALTPVYQRLQQTQPLLGKTISFDNNFNILVDGQPAKTLSGSGRLKTSIILKDALCQTAGLKFFAEDEINLLDQDNKGRLFKLLLSIADDYDTVMLCAATSDVAPKPSPDPRIQIWSVKDGTVKRLSTG
jgi:DNA repair exonuclease SbcCD ATPase subunit